MWPSISLTREAEIGKKTIGNLTGLKENCDLPKCDAVKLIRFIS